MKQLIQEEAKDAANSQREKIGQIATALLEEGFVSITERARALGLLRSTTWSILRAGHKRYGMSAIIICRMQAHKDLPDAVRAILRDYVIAKAEGRYGHTLFYRRRFAAHFVEMPELAGFQKPKRVVA